MTRLIDADALNKKLCETTIFIKGGEMFQRMINDAPTIEPNGDLISRADAMGAVQDHFNADGFKGYDDGQKMMDRIKALPSAEQVTGKLNNPDDSLLTADSEACKEQKSKLDLISRRDAINAIENTDCELTTKDWDELTGALKSLPSAPDSRQRGEWIFEPKDAIELMFTKPKCSECGFESADGGNFCSNCGARMYKGGEDE